MRVEIRRFVTVDHVDGYVLLVVSSVARRRSPGQWRCRYCCLRPIRWLRNREQLRKSNDRLSNESEISLDPRTAPNRVNNGLRFVFVMGYAGVEQGGQVGFIVFVKR